MKRFDSIVLLSNPFKLNNRVNRAKEAKDEASVDKLLELVDELTTSCFHLFSAIHFSQLASSKCVRWKWQRSNPPYMPHSVADIFTFAELIQFLSKTYLDEEITISPMEAANMFSISAQDILVGDLIQLLSCQMAYFAGKVMILNPKRKAGSLPNNESKKSKILHINPSVCSHRILKPEHYRPNGTCRCDDPNHIQMEDWGYEWEDDEKLWI